jgi:hypothetical protein
MGLLDDAIREHLELKRRHGADPDEISRQEREALGAPPQREFAPAAGEAAAEPEPAEAPESEVDAELSQPPAAEEPAAVAAEEDAPAPGYEEEPWLADAEPDEVPAADSLDVVPPDAEPPGEDVLEETPEFLQETPEHDRLWFEQKPPRDFDWDK